MKFWIASDYGFCHLLPFFGVGEVRCADPDCGAVHGWMVQVGWGFWAVGISVWRIAP